MLYIGMATTDPMEYTLFKDHVHESGMPYKINLIEKKDDELLKDSHVIITDLALDSGQLIDELILWPHPFILLGNPGEEEKMEEMTKDESSFFILRDENYNHIRILPAAIRKVLNHHESILLHQDFIREKEDSYYNLVQALPDIVYSLDENGNFTFVNNSVGAIGYRPEELVGKHFSLLLCEEDILKVSRVHVLPKYFGKVTGNEQSPKLFDERRSGERKTVNLELKLKHKNGSENSHFLGSITSYGEISSKGISTGIKKHSRKIGTVGIIRDITSRRETEEKLLVSLREKEILIKEIHHRVKNNLQIISSLLSLQSESVKNNEAEHIFTASQARIQSMALIHEQLYQAKTLHQISMLNYFNSLTEKLLSVYEADSRLKLLLDIEDIFLEVEKATPLALIFTELFSNAVKYAFRDVEDGTISVVLKTREDGSCCFSVADNGIGFHHDSYKEKETSLGLNLVKSLSEQLYGTLDFEGPPGSKFTVLFPIT